MTLLALMAFWILIDCPVCAVVETPVPTARPTMSNSPPAISITPAPSQIATAEKIPTPAPTPTPAGQPTPPPLNNPQNPNKYGADPTGAKDSTAAFNNALAAGDLDIPANSAYLINGRVGGTGGFSGSKNIRCEGAGASRSILKYTGAPAGMFTIGGGGGGSFFNCQFRGNGYNVTGCPPVDSRNFTAIIFGNNVETGTVNGFRVIGNDFNGIGGYNGAVEIAGRYVQHVITGWNTFEHCGLRGYELQTGHDNIFEYNTLSDCGDVQETWGTTASRDATKNNISQHNTYAFPHGTGQWTGCGGAYSASSANAVGVQTCHVGRVQNNGITGGNEIYQYNSMTGAVASYFYIGSGSNDGNCATWVPGRYIGNTVSGRSAYYEPTAAEPE